MSTEGVGTFGATGVLQTRVLKAMGVKILPGLFRLILVALRKPVPGKSGKKFFRFIRFKV